MKTVLFACVHNAGRSQMAAALFNRLADPDEGASHLRRHRPGSARSPGSGDRDERGGGRSVEARDDELTSELAQQAQMLITMGCGDQCPVVPGVKRDDWPLEDPKGKSIARVREIRDEIRQRVEVANRRGVVCPHALASALFRSLWRGSSVLGFFVPGPLCGHRSTQGPGTKDQERTKHQGLRTKYRGLISPVSCVVCPSR